MAVTTIGQPATDRSTTKSISSFTNILYGGAADNSGKLDYVGIRMNSNGTGVKVGTLELTAYVPVTFAGRDSVTIGNVSSGSEQIFTGLSLDVVAGDYIGIYGTGGNIECDNNANYGYYAGGDRLDSSYDSYNQTNGYMSLYGRGVNFVPKVII